MNQAFNVLRNHARARNQRCPDLAQAFADGSETLTGPAASKTRSGHPALRRYATTSRGPLWSPDRRSPGPETALRRDADYHQPV